MNVLDIEPVKSKKELKKALKKEQKVKGNTQNGVNATVESPDYSTDLYGDKPVNVVKSKNTTEIISINSINETFDGNNVLIGGFLQQVRKTGKQAFLVIRQKYSTIQCIAYSDDRISKQMIQFIGNIPRESLVEVSGVVKKVEKPVESCSQSLIEIHVNTVFVVSRAKSRLNLQIEDLMRSDKDTTLAKVNLDTILDNRTLSLRTPTNIAIFTIKGVIESTFRNYLESLEFIRIDPVGIVAGSSEGGADVFKVDYYNEKGFLAQSPQLYKQMAIVSGYEKVYVTGLVWRAENSNTHRHLSQFSGLDLEMKINNHYHEVLNLICETMIAIFGAIEQRCQKEISIVNKQYEGVEPFKYLVPTLVLTFAEGVSMLRDAGAEIDDFEDLSTPNEKLLGKLVKKKYSTDFFALDRFPAAARPFYTMPDPVDARYSNSYDLFMRGEEILSGGQRIHVPDMLKASASQRGINLDSIKDYLEAFEDGCSPHGGGGLGLERVLMLYLGLDNIRLATMYPRDPRRLRP